MTTHHKEQPLGGRLVSWPIMVFWALSADLCHLDS
ncbi:Uncharacterised protein [Providencia rettgeri]|uniref:Uncharacterized protein n=1 Tax=Providencia rettgeri TaxID=587 RepID=A0A379FVB5_PRORE|nr:Uncharacterised protein [Providencia rettgeri]